MKCTFTGLINCMQVMSIFVLTSELPEVKKSKGIYHNSIGYDNPNFRQSLLSQTFISSARNLFNREKPSFLYKQISDHNSHASHDIKSQDRYEHGLMSFNRGANKNKDDKVGYYSMDNGGNDVDLENTGGNSLIDTYPTINNNRYSGYKHRIPVQCMKINPLQLFCVHGDVIYKLHLPNNDLNEEELGKIVETVYKEIEVKRLSTNERKIYKRETGNKCREIEEEVVPIFPGHNGTQILQFTLPAMDSEDFKKKKIKQSSEFITEYLKPPKGTPYDFLFQDIGRYPYSSKWLSKRQANKVVKNKPKTNGLDCRTTRAAKIFSVSEGKCGKCLLPKSYTHKCRLRVTCPCANPPSVIPDQTTCPPLPPLPPEVISTRCPAPSVKVKGSFAPKSKITPELTEDPICAELENDSTLLSITGDNINIKLDFTKGERGKAKKKLHRIFN